MDPHVPPADDGSSTDRRQRTDDRSSGRDGTGRDTDAAPSFTRRRVLQTGAAAALAGGAALGTGSNAAAAPGDPTPSYEEARQQLSHPDPAEEAVALYRYLHDVWGEQILSGQQWEPWGIDEMDHIQSITGQQPAVYGGDFILDDKSIPVDRAIDWWERGGISKLMWHWGVPGQETPEDEYEQSRDTGVQIDLQLILQEGTEPNQAFYDEMDEVANELKRLRDRGIPVVFGPFHEFEGGWFWWGYEDAAFFREVWETMHDYFTTTHDLDNLIWLLPHSDYPEANWVPDESTFDLAGADTYDSGDSYQWLYQNVVDVHGEDRPIVMHEIGRDGGTGQPPDPDLAAQDGSWWSMWVNWHTDWLDRIEDDYLDYVYNHELTGTLSDVPDIVAEYGEDGGGGEQTPCDEVGAQGGVEVDGEWICDVDGDGLYRDFTVDGEVGQDDVVAFFERQHRNPFRGLGPVDYSGNGSVGHEDVVALFEDVVL